MAKQNDKQKAAQKTIHDATWIAAQLDSFAREISNAEMLEHAVVVGILNRGAELARRVCHRIHAFKNIALPYGALNIALYRDDVALRGPKLSTHKKSTSIPVAIDQRVVFLVDDVLFTGRTIRAALALLNDFGRPAAVRLYSLIDRGGRELPIQPDRVGCKMVVPVRDRVDVRLKEIDGEEGVFVVVDGMRRES